MTESFAQLFEESLKEIETRPGSIVRGVVVAIDKDVVLVDAGLKSESAIPAEQFKNAQGERIEIRGFGSFSLHYRAPRTGRNPKTGDKVELEGKYVPHFKPGKELRDRANIYG